VADLQAYGLGSSAPKGWESAIYRREPEVVSVRSADGLAFTRATAEPTPILHLANFPLPAERGDYGGGAVEQMGSGGIFISLRRLRVALTASLASATSFSAASSILSGWLFG